MRSRVVLGKRWRASGGGGDEGFPKPFRDIRDVGDDRRELPVLHRANTKSMRGSRDVGNDHAIARLQNAAGAEVLG